MILVRHNQLQEPYNNYEILSLGQLDDLATGKVSPSIQGIGSIDVVDTKIIAALLDADVVLCSESLRTQLTCQSILSLLNINLSIQIDSRLNEILFTPSKMVPSDNPVSPLVWIRDGLYKHMLDGSPYVDSKYIIQERIESLMDDYQGQNTVCFSHGFLMRLILSYQKSNQDIDIALKGISEIQPINYLQPIFI